MQWYLWIKVFHLVFMIGFMAALFYLPRILVNLGEAGNLPAVRERLVLMGQRLYRFGLVMFVLSVLPGIALWFGHHFLTHFPGMVAPGTGWIHAKLALVTGLFAYHLWIGARLRKVAAGADLPSPTAMRIVNELPVLVLIVILWLVLAKPF